MMCAIVKPYLNTCNGATWPSWVAKAERSTEICAPKIQADGVTSVAGAREMDALKKTSASSQTTTGSGATSEALVVQTPFLSVIARKTIAVTKTAATEIEEIETRIAQGMMEIIDRDHSHGRDRRGAIGIEMITDVASEARRATMSGTIVTRDARWTPGRLWPGLDIALIIPKSVESSTSTKPPPFVLYSPFLHVSLDYIQLCICPSLYFIS
jgi:hypothetical protein